jgi:hypothetical protein
MESTFSFLLFFTAVPMLIAFPLTSFLCRRRTAYQKPISHETMLLGGFIAAVICFVFTSGGLCFTPVFWIELAPGTELTFVYSVATGILSAGAVVIYYKKKNKGP